jgi:hypothetical protein
VASKDVARTVSVTGKTLAVVVRRKMAKMPTANCVKYILASAVQCSCRG